NETMLIYVPIADMLGIRLFKEELEDIAIRALDPHGCAEIDAWLAADKAQREIFLQSIQDNLREHLTSRFAESGMPNSGVHVEGRVKSMHGIYRKHFTQGRGFEEIFDIYAVRVIVESEEECWAVLGWVHQIYREIPKRQKNYISSPKPNGYQSLHLTMVGEDKIPFEVQIRTWDMHEIAERGVAGHWKYKQGIGARQTGLEEQLARIQELIDSYRDADSVEDVVAAIRSDISPMEKVYPVTPKGEAKELKLGSTVLDFAYAVHTGVGHRFAGAKVNGRIAAATYQVQSGDVVEILTAADRDRGPSRDWLQVVVTSQAKTKIRNWFKKERREENILTGQKLVDGEHRRNFTLLDATQWEEILLRVLDRKQFEKGIATAARLQDFYAALGYGGLNMQSFLPLLREEYQKIVRAQQEVKLKKITSDKGVVVQGIDNCQVKFAQCCHPVPQDDIIGYITRGSVRDALLRPGGVTVHRTCCVNVPRDLPSSPEPDRWLQAMWDTNTASNNYLGNITVHTNGRTGLLADVTGVFKHMHVDVSSLQLLPNNDGSSKICIVIAVHSRSHLDTICQKVFAVKGVTQVEY
ncbi:MAG: TGS domain-containing protein, partial [Oscillospiraceae bacterium]|nr:TGS domain-containing protein [Oscillospiraceae bacterium]